MNSNSNFEIADENVIPDVDNNYDRKSIEEDTEVASPPPPLNLNISSITRFNLKRQRNIYTDVKSQFNVSAEPFVSTQKPNILSLFNEQPYGDQHSNTQHIDKKPNSYLKFYKDTPPACNFDIQPMQMCCPMVPPSIPVAWCTPLERQPATQFCGMCKKIYPPNVFPPTPNPDNSKPMGQTVLPNGVIQLHLRNDIRIDITLGNTIRLFNSASKIVIALSNKNCSSAAMIHPNGRVYQVSSRVEIVAHDGMKKNSYVRYGKMWSKGISFTSENCALTYLLDSAGTRTTTDNFYDMTTDITSTVFFECPDFGTQKITHVSQLRTLVLRSFSLEKIMKYTYVYVIHLPNSFRNAKFGPEYKYAALSVIQNSYYHINEDGTEILDINGLRVAQSLDGMVKITQSTNKLLVRTSPGNGSATIATPHLHCTASMGETSHLFVRSDGKRMHFDGTTFVVRNAGHTAGFNEENLLVVY